MKTELPLRGEKGVDTLRKSGIEVVGDIPWGTHLCQFYETKEDLIDIMVPYFAEGLRNNEFCMWVTSPPLGVEEARAALQKAVPDLEQYMEKGQIEILPHTDWYLLGGEFDAHRVLEGWVEKEKGALDRGFAGLRLTGNTFWIERRGWKSFVDYEATVNAVIGKHRMIAICSYSLDKCNARDVVDAIRNHESVLIRRGGIWIVAEDFLRRRLLEEKLRESEEELRKSLNKLNLILSTLEDGVDIVSYDYIVHYQNKFLKDRFGDLTGKKCYVGYMGFEKPCSFCPMRKAIKYRKTFRVELTGKDGRSYELISMPLEHPDGRVDALEIVRDITERKKAEEALRESEEKFRNIFESANDGMIYVDESGRILGVNEKAVQLYGGSKKELLGKHFTKLGEIPPKYMPTLISNFVKTLAGEKTYIDICIKNKKGQEMHFESSASLVKIKGKPAAVLCIVRDVTERKKMEEKLRESEEKWRSLVELAPDGIITADIKGVITSVNNAFLRLTGYTKEEIVGKHFTKLQTIRPRDIPRYIKFMGSALRGKLPPPFEYSYVRKDRTVGWGEAHVGFLKKGGKTIGFQVILREISERKRAELASRLSEQKYRNIFENARDAIVTFDLKGNVTAVNKVAEEYGFKKDEMIGKSMFKFVSKKYWPRLLKELSNIAQGKMVEGEIELITPKGKKIAEYRSNPIRQGNKVVGLQTILRDVTERKQMRKKLEDYSRHLEELVEKRTRQLKEAQEQLIRSERLAAIGKMATMIGHDLRNPLQAIENATYYLNNELPFLSPSLPNPQKTMEMLQVINDSVNYADKIIKDLHDFSATKKPTLKKTNINTLVKETLSQVKAPENVKLITELGHLPKIKADKDMIKRAFLNLAINGIQAMEKGGNLKVSTKKTKGFIEVSFKDTGPGIPKENMKKIFTPFFTTRAKGMGMGLAICKKFVEIHGGTIHVESEEGKGSTFTVKLPIQQKNGGENH